MISYPLLNFARLAGLISAAAHANPAAMSIYTVNYPLQYFAQRIAGEYAKVVFPAPQGVDPAFWTPDPSAIAAYQDADQGRDPTSVALTGPNGRAHPSRGRVSRAGLVGRDDHDPAIRVLTLGPARHAGLLVEHVVDHLPIG